MSLALAAQHLASQGRKNDTELVHMSKPEVAGLQQLAQQHGGNLTRNPTTGLIEAGFLDSILPTLAGAALTVAFPEMGALEAAGLVGGGATLMSGGNLQKGLMAGLGAYGGAGLGAGLMQTGASTLAGEDALQAAAGNLSSTVATPVAQTPALGTFDKAINPSDATAWGSADTTGVAGNVSAQQQATQAAQAYKTAADQTALQNWNDVSQGFNSRYAAALKDTPGASMLQGVQNIGNPGGIYDLSTKLNGNMGALKYLGAAAAPSIMDMASQPVGHTAASDYLNTVRPYKFSQYHDPNAPINSQTPYFTQTMTALPTYVAPYAGGGLAHGPARGESLRGTMGALHGTERLMTYAEGGATESQMNVNAMGGSGNDVSQAYGNMNYQMPLDEATMLRLALAGHFAQGKNFQNNGIDSRSIGISHRLSPNSSIEGMLESSAHPMPGREPINRAGVNYNRSFAAGGISNLGSYSDGGQLLRGPGDGVSDDIPAQIGQHQPARLAEGEFVVPARIVSELGNGSTNAGAKRLYDMMNRIQAGRSKTMGGKSAYAKDTNAEQHLPA